MSAARRQRLSQVNPGAKKRAPKANTGEWADHVKERTKGVLDRCLWSGVRRRNGHVLITDGPFTETKE